MDFESAVPPDTRIIENTAKRGFQDFWAERGAGRVERHSDSPTIRMPILLMGATMGMLAV
jgi:hypothetical protein